MEDVPMIHYSQGDIIFIEGDLADGVYLILKGKVEISQKQGPKQVVLAQQGENTIFGEMALLDNRPRSATARAIEDSYCYRLSAHDFIRKLIRVNSAVREAFQDMVLTIRLKNKIDTNELPDWLIEEKESRTPRSKQALEQDNNLQNAVKELDPFMGAVYRVLFTTAFQ